MHRGACPRAVRSTDPGALHRVRDTCRRPRTVAPVIEWRAKDQCETPTGGLFPAGARPATQTNAERLAERPRSERRRLHDIRRQINSHQPRLVPGQRVHGVRLKRIAEWSVAKRAVGRVTRAGRMALIGRRMQNPFHPDGACREQYAASDGSCRGWEILSSAQLRWNSMLQKSPSGPPSPRRSPQRRRTPESRLLFPPRQPFAPHAAAKS
jgi:hypothetical protein